MNALINQHIETIEEWLLQSASVDSYQIIRKEIIHASGKIRLKVLFTNGDVVELFEYIMIQANTIHLDKYSFHWQTAIGELKSRWDNAPHHPELPNAPHHKHNADSSIVGISEKIDMFSVLNFIESVIKN